MQEDKQESKSLQETVADKREYLKLSDIDTETMEDIQAMFGLWKEADHCD